MSAPDDGPFYARSSCLAALEVVMSTKPEETAALLERLAESPDVEDKACAVWLELPLNEIEMSLEGKGHGLPERRAKRLLRLFKFSKYFQKRGRHFAMLELEARMHRVRLLVEKGDRMKALSEARTVERMLARVGDSPNPTVKYVRGVTRLAVSQSAFPLRMLLGMAGVSGDEEQGRRLLEELVQGKTVYAGDALYLLHHFAHENNDLEASLHYGERLVAKYPQNPQFAYEYGKALRDARKYEEVLALTSPFLERMTEDPNAWTDRIRKKIYFLSAEVALEVGKKQDAKRWAVLASQQKYGGLVSETSALLKRF